MTLKVWNKPSIEVTKVKLAQNRNVAHTDATKLHKS
jgi:hypothetical protein